MIDDNQTASAHRELAISGWRGAVPRGSRGERRPDPKLRAAILVSVVMLVQTLTFAFWQGTTPTTSAPSVRQPNVTSTQPPPGTETLGVRWLRIAVPDGGAIVAAVARPTGVGPFPAVLLLHGTHGFTKEYVQWATDVSRSGFLTVAACWFSGGGGAGALAVTQPISCPELPPLRPGDYPEGQHHIDALVRAIRTLPDVLGDHVALLGHSRGGGAALQYVLGGGRVQAVVLHSSGYALKPEARAAELTVPILILHGTADGPADGGSANTTVGKAREFEAALRRTEKSVEAAYYEGGGHNSFFTNSIQRADELKTMIAFLRRHVGG